MKSATEIIKAFGGCPAFARAVGITDSHARTMLARNSIPPRHWQVVVSAAEAAGIEGITLGALAESVADQQRATA